MKRYMKYLTAAGALAIAAPLAAQRPQAQPPQDSIPAEHRPPPGMCRIWLDGVPAGRQPEVTDCASAIRRRPPNGRVIFGPEVQRVPPRSFRPEEKRDSTQQNKRRKPDEGASGLRLPIGCKRPG